MILYHVISNDMWGLPQGDSYQMKLTSKRHSNGQHAYFNDIKVSIPLVKHLIVLGIEKYG